jgi:hypothetical protein
LLSDLAGASDQVELVSRAEQLELMKPETLAGFSDVWVLDDSAEPEPAQLEEAAETDPKSEVAVSQEAIPLVGLHAKLYVIDEGWNASIFTGSANATHAAFHQNVEFLAQMRGKKSKIGVAAILGESKKDESASSAGAASLMDMLQPFKPAESAEPADESEKKFERYVDELARQLSSSQPVAVCSDDQDGQGFQVCLKPTKRSIFQVGDEYSIAARLASRPAATPVPIKLDEDVWASFASLSMLSLTSFIVFSVSTDQPRKMSREFVLNLPLVNEPEGRKETLLRHLLSDKDRVLRFMMLLLSDADASAFAEFAGGSQTAVDSFQFSSMLDGRTLFESLMKCVAADPSRLQQVATMIADLQNSEDGKALLPDDLELIWQPIWAIAEEELAKRSKGGKL